MGDLLTEVRVARRLAGSGRAVRERVGVSRKRLAQELGVAESTISRWESGERRPRGALRVRYVELLDALRREAEDGAA